VNGVILDPSGPFLSDSSNEDGVSDMSDSDTRCFIATAAYGSYLHPHVKALRDFRDDILLPRQFGRAFVDVYYRASPPLTNFIKEHHSAHVASQLLLTPIVYSIRYPRSAIIIFLMILGFELARRKK
jgi:hypothetical protein